MSISAGHKRLVKTLYRTLLRNAVRVGREKGGYLQLQEPPTKEEHSSLSTVPPDYDRRLLDSYVPYYLRDQVSKTALTSKELYEIIRRSFHKMKGLTSRSKRPTINEAVDDAMQMMRFLDHQVELLRCTSITETNGIRVLCTSFPMITDLQQQHHMSLQLPVPPIWQFLYRVRVENWSEVTVQLLGRHWIIEDQEGVQVDGVSKGSPGVVGHQPILKPGYKIMYVSSSNLPTAQGAMRGSFQMLVLDSDDHDNNRFDAKIDRFRLISRQATSRPTTKPRSTSTSTGSGGGGGEKR